LSRSARRPGTRLGAGPLVGRRLDWSSFSALAGGGWVAGGGQEAADRRTVGRAAAASRKRDGLTTAAEAEANRSWDKLLWTVKLIVGPELPFSLIIQTINR
jgi:hypothetical protein